MPSEKYGFVYVWRDKKRKMFYVGCHWGDEQDGYICSSNRMRNAFSRRPTDFKRRVVSRVFTNRQDLLAEEHKLLSQIKDEELGKKFYNISKRHFGHWTASDNVSSISEKISLAKKGKPGRKISEEHKRKLSALRKGKPLTDDHKKKLAESGTWTNIKPGAWNVGCKWYNNGTKSIQVRGEPPEGFVLGRLINTMSQLEI